MFDRNIGGNRVRRKFDEIEKQKLGKYVYALRDPRDGKIFYVGQGTDDRLFSHFDEADDCLRKGLVASSKVLRILDIWKNEEDVDWFIVAHKLADNAVNGVESAVIDALSMSQNGVCLNEVSGPHSSMLEQNDIRLLGATPVNPDVPLNTVFIFPIQNALADGRNAYDATRGAWYVKKEYQKLPAYAVGIKNGISVGSYYIKQWSLVDNKYEFEGEDEPVLLNKNWQTILSAVKGYWQRGNFIIVSFDGKGKYRIVRGAGDVSTWRDIIV